MSGGRAGSYRLSAAYLAQLRAAAELAESQRRWRRERSENTRLISRLAEVAQRGGKRVRTLELTEPRGRTASEVDVEVDAARAENARLRQELAVETKRAREASVFAAVKGLVTRRREPSATSANTATEANRPQPVEQREPVGVSTAAKLIAKLDDGAQVSDRALKLAAELEQAQNDAARALIAARLRDETRSINTLYRRRVAEQELLDDAHAVAQDTADAELLKEISSADKAFQQGEPVNQARLDAHVARARQRAAQARSDELVRDNLVRAFQDLGLRVEDRFAVALPHGGTLVRRDRFARHAIKVEVTDSRVRLTPVHLVADERPPSRAEAAAERSEGQAADQTYCKDIAQALDDLARKAIPVDAGPGAAPGLTVPERLVVPGLSKIQQRRGRPHERGQEYGAGS